MTKHGATATKERPSDKIDLRRSLPRIYTAKQCRPELVQVPPVTFLMIDGRGDPNSTPAFSDSIKALFTTAYGTKFTLKRTGTDFSVMPLETQWWSESEPFDIENKDGWSWTAMIAVPDFVTSRLVAEVVGRAYAKDPIEALRTLRLERFEEGMSAQVLHIGPYDTEGPTIVSLHQFIIDSGLRIRGKHHEIYFSDPRRTTPDKLRTLIRQPCET